MTISSARPTRLTAFKVFFAAIAAVALTFGGISPAVAAEGTDVELFSTIPEVHPDSSASLAFHSNRLYELGSIAELDGDRRDLQRVEIGFVSWACEDGYYQKEDDPCVTTNAGAGFTHPITVNLYEEGESGVVGERIASVTQETFVPYRPSAVEECSSPIGGFLDSAGECVRGLFFVASFDFSALELTLPDRLIVAATYNSTNGGYEPMGQIPAGEEDGFNVLNMAIGGLSPARVGTLDNQIYLSGAQYNDVLSTPYGWANSGYAPQISLIAFDPAEVPVSPGEETDEPGAESVEPGGNVTGSEEAAEPTPTPAPKRPERVETGL